MKTIITTVIATLFISLPVTVFAEGGYHWEKKAEQKEMSHKMSMDSHMSHSASGHGSMMTHASGAEGGHMKKQDAMHKMHADKMKTQDKGK